MMGLDALIDEVLRICDSERNRENLRKSDLLLRRCKRCVPPIYVRPERTYMAEMTGINFKDIFSDIESYLSLDLLTKIFTFRELQDDTPIRPQVELFFGVPFTMSFLGTPWKIVEKNEPWPEGPVLSELSPLPTIEEPDFYESGMMPLAHRFYREAQALLDGRLKVVFPRWYTGCFDIALQMRGHEGLYLDFYDHPTEVSQLLRRIFEIRMRWEETRNSLFDRSEGTIWGFDRGANILADDEVNAEVISPEHYRRFVLPYHLEYAQHYDDIYFHSCGKLDPMYSLISTIPNLNIVDVGPFSTFDKALAAFGERVIYERNYSVDLTSFDADLQNELHALMRTARERGLFVYVLLDVDTYSEAAKRRTRDWIDTLRRTRDEFFPSASYSLAWEAA